MFTLGFTLGFTGTFSTAYTLSIYFSNACFVLRHSALPTLPFPLTYQPAGQQQETRDDNHDPRRPRNTLSGQLCPLSP